jgi:uncharacterized protein YndB with AHSA1/START domain
MNEADDDSTVLEVSRVIAATKETLFDAWTKPDAIRAWFAPGPMTTPEAEMDVRPGGRYRVAMRDPDGKTFVVGGEYVEVVPNERLVFTGAWEVKDHDADREETRVTLALRAAEGGTEVRVLHERFTSPESRARHRHGWNGCLEKLPGFVRVTAR